MTAAFCSTLLKVQVYSVRRPNRHAAAEEILIFRPNWQFQQECRGDNWPIVGIAQTDPLTGGTFMFLIQAAVHSLHDANHLVQHGEPEVYVESSVLCNYGYVFLSVFETHIRSVEVSLTLICLKNLSDSNSKYRT